MNLVKWFLEKLKQPFMKKCCNAQIFLRHLFWDNYVTMFDQNSEFGLKSEAWTEGWGLILWRQTNSLTLARVARMVIVLGGYSNHKQQP